jgi:hypothetical protein
MTSPVAQSAAVVIPAAGTSRVAGHHPTITAATMHLFGFTVHDTFGMADGEIRMADPGRHHRHPDHVVRHLPRPADPIRPARHAAVRASAEPASAVHWPALLYLPGGCATYRFSFAPGASPALAVTADSALSFVPRPALVDFVRRTEGLALCGRGAHAPDESGGGTRGESSLSSSGRDRPTPSGAVTAQALCARLKRWQPGKAL